jgi:outer membrane protein
VGLLTAATGICQQRLLLQDAIAKALKNSLDIQLANNNWQIAQINNHPGFAGALPTVTAGITDNEQLSSTSQKFANPNNNIDRSNVAVNNLSANVTGSIVLFNGKRIVATQQRLAALQQLNKWQLNAQVQNCIANVSVRYYDVARQQWYANTLVQSIAVAEQKLALLTERKAIGTANNADIFQAQLDVNALQQQLQNQELIIEQAKIELQSAMYETANTTNFRVADSILVNTQLHRDSLLNTLLQNPQIAAATEQINVLGFIEKETAALRYPTIRATTGYSFSNNKAAAGFNLLTQSYGPFIGINVSVPIYAGNTAKKQLHIAELNTQNARLQKENLLLNTHNSFSRNYTAYQSHLQQLATQQKNYQLSLQLLQLVQQKFALQQATIIDVKQAQQSFENESYRLVNLRFAAKTAEITLLQLSSKLGN